MALRVFAREKDISLKTGIALLNEASAPATEDSYMILERNKLDGRLQVSMYGETTKRGGNEKPFSIDFLEGKLARRGNAASVSGELVVKAVGGTKLFKTSSGSSASPLVFDLTAGLGRDAFILACAGFNVCLFERNMVIYTLLRDALQRLESQNKALGDRLHLYHWQDESIYDEALVHFDDPSVVYLDPMYSTGNVGAKAAVKKETQILKRLLGDAEGLDESNSRALLNAALDMASSRVVVKRAIEATPLCGAPAHESITRSTHRCDLYFPQRAVHFPDLTL